VCSAIGESSDCAVDVENVTCCLVYTLCFVRQDLRRHARELLNARVQLIATDPGGVARYFPGRCVDVSESGIRVELRDRLETRSYVSFQLESPRFGGSGSVRHETRSRMGWEYGLEFSGGLKWR
jgi:hypothetical protein